MRSSTINALPACLEVGLICVSLREAGQISSLSGVTAGNPSNFPEIMASYLDAVKTNNPQGGWAVVSLTRRPA